MEQLLLIMMVVSLVWVVLCTVYYTVRGMRNKTNEKRTNEVNRLIMASSMGKYSSLSKVGEV